MVLTWVGGFDIIYAQQDAEFDSANKLYSIPSHFGSGRASRISSVLHLVSILTAILVGLKSDAGIVYFAGTLIFSILLLIEHIVARQYGLCYNQ